MKYKVPCEQPHYRCKENIYIEIMLTGFSYYSKFEHIFLPSDGWSQDANAALSGRHGWMSWSAADTQLYCSL